MHCIQNLLADDRKTAFFGARFSRHSTWAVFLAPPKRDVMDASSLSLGATVRKAERLRQVLSRCKGSLDGFQSAVPRSVLPSRENELVGSK